MDKLKKVEGDVPKSWLADPDASIWDENVAETLVPDWLDHADDPSDSTDQNINNTNEHCNGFPRDVRPRKQIRLPNKYQGFVLSTCSMALPPGKAREILQMEADRQQRIKESRKSSAGRRDWEQFRVDDGQYVCRHCEHSSSTPDALRKH